MKPSVCIYLKTNTLQQKCNKMVLLATIEWKRRSLLSGVYYFCTGLLEFGSAYFASIRKFSTLQPTRVRLQSTLSLQAHFIYCYSYRAEFSMVDLAAPSVPFSSDMKDTSHPILPWPIWHSPPWKTSQLKYAPTPSSGKGNLVALLRYG